MREAQQYNFVLILQKQAHSPLVIMAMLNFLPTQSHVAVSLQPKY